MITQLIWTIWTPMSSVPKKADKLNLSLLQENTAMALCKTGISIAEALGIAQTYTKPLICCQLFNSLAAEKFEWNFRFVIFKRILVIAGWGISCEIAMIWMSLDLIDDQSTLVQVMAWCRQAPSHYLIQCWPRSLSPYGVIRPES